MIFVLTMLLSAGVPHVTLHASVDGAQVPGWAYAKVGQRVMLTLETSGPPKTARWFKLEPTQRALDNTTPRFHFAQVPFAKTAVAACDDEVTCEADVLPVVLAPKMPGAGTMAFQVEVTLADGTRAQSPGLEAMKYGGLTHDVMRVTFRLDDTLLGYASELVNTPYIFGSAGPDGRNQSDLLIGSDCADFIIYARRRMGFKAAYTSSYDLERQAPPLKKGQAVKRGDIVYFTEGRHVGLLFTDNPPLGVLDESDILFHTCWDTPKLEVLGEVTCAAPPWRVLRFR